MHYHAVIGERRLQQEVLEKGENLFLLHSERNNLKEKIQIVSHHQHDM
jgi:hypothetical protein